MQQIKGLRQNKKTPQSGDLLSCKFNLVRHAGEKLHQIRDEIARWREILDIPYRCYLLGDTSAN